MSAPTTTLTWLDELRTRVNDTSARIVSAFANLQQDQQRISRTLDEVIDRLAGC